MKDNDFVEALINHLAGSLHRSVRMADDAALVAADAHVTRAIALLVRRDTDIPVRIVSIPPSLQAAAPIRKAAVEAGLGLVERFAPSAPPPDPIQEAARESRRILLLDGSRLVDQAASEETEAVKQVQQARHARAESLKVQLRFPLLDRGVLPFLGHLRKQQAPPGGWWEAMAAQLTEDDLEKLAETCARK